MTNCDKNNYKHLHCSLWEASLVQNSLISFHEPGSSSHVDLVTKWAIRPAPIDVRITTNKIQIPQHLLIKHPDFFVMSLSGNSLVIILTSLNVWLVCAMSQRIRSFAERLKRAARGYPAQNWSRYTGLNLNSTRPPKMTAFLILEHLLYLCWEGRGGEYYSANFTRQNNPPSFHPPIIWLNVYPCKRERLT